MVKISDHVFVYYPIMKPRPGGMGCSIYIIQGTKFTALIDTSTKGGGIDEKKAKEMVEDGIDLSKLEIICITHPHPDHIRGIPFWVGKAGKQIPVYIHPKGVKYIQDQSIYLADLQATLGSFQKYVSRIPPGPGETVTNWFWGSYSKYENVKAVQDEQIFDLGDVTIKALWTPGHSLSHTVYEVQESKGNSTRYLISGDLISFKDMKDGKGLRGLASFNTPLSSYEAEIASLNRIAQNPPDKLLTGHYGIYKSKAEIQHYFQGAAEEGVWLWNRTLEVLKKEGPQHFRPLTKKVINFPKYLSGVATRTSSMFVLLREMQTKNLVKKQPNSQDIFALVE